MHSKILAVAVFAVVAIPTLASAHAIPVAMVPESSAVLEQAPATLSIRFSERVEPGASAITVAGPSMTMRSKVAADPTDPRTLVVPVMDDGNGTYVVSWSVVSSDDGHFTKGAYAFAVGAGAIPATTTQGTEVITIATAPEALGMTIELMGNGIIWAALLFFAFVARPLKNKGTLGNDEGLVRVWGTRLVYFAGVLVVGGGLLQLAIKGGQLASLQEIGFWQGLVLYIGTTAGSATLYRMGAVVAAVLLYGFCKRHIFDSGRFTRVEGALMGLMGIFAFFRAVVSHATANPFLPPLSTGVNFVHVIEKDVWAGLTLLLVLLAVHPRTRTLLASALPRVSALLAINLGIISVTGTYIVWLHLKDFGNLLTTQWGTVFLQLLLAAVLVVALRTYHVLARRWRPRLFFKLLPFSLGAEFVAALLVVAYSSVVIITSPPLPQPHAPVFSAHDQGITIELVRDRYEDGKLLLTTSGDQTPTVTLQDKGGTAGALSVDLAQRFAGGYAFPQSLLAGTGPFKLVVTSPQSGGYDAHATFVITKGAYDAPADWERRRPLDAFTSIMLLIALAALAAAWALYRLSKHDVPEDRTTRSLPEFQVLAGCLLVALLAPAALGWFGSSRLANAFKAECEADGNMWHLMQPTKAGVPQSGASAEGCMWGMGDFMYMFADRREYDYYQSLPQAAVTLDHAPFVAGVPATFTVQLAEQDGSPATLFVDMEKLIHVVVVSRDQSAFAHIHSDDTKPLAQQDKDSSTFTLAYTFPKSGEYLIAVDYAHGLTLESKQFLVEVAGGPGQAAQPTIYPSTGTFGDYSVALDYFQPFAKEAASLKYTITKDGEPVTDVVPYLAAAMHVSAVKNDLSQFVHTHGEVHPPGTPYPPLIIKDGQIVHSMASMVLPTTMGPDIEAHLIFPTAGLYTVWGEFKVGSTVIPTSFTVRVEE